MKRRVGVLEQRMDVLERMLNAPSYTKIVSSVEKHLSKIPVIKNIYIKSTQSGFLLTLVYNTEFIFQAIEQTRPGIMELEDEFPNVYFDTWFFHVNEVQKEDLQQSTMIFARKND